MSLRTKLLIALFVILLIYSPGRARSTTNSEIAVRYWAAAYGLDPERLWGRALCESSGNPYAQNGDHYGLFQFLPSTYASLRAQENSDPSLAPNLSGYDPEWRWIDDAQGAASAHIAAWAQYRGYGYLWSCGY